MNNLKQAITKNDLILLGLTIKAGKGLAFLTGKSCFDIGVALAWTAPVVFGSSFIFGAVATDSLHYIILGLILTPVWAWLVHLNTKLYRKFKRLAEDGRLNMGFLAEHILRGATKRYWLSMIFLLEISFGIALITTDPESFFDGISLVVRSFTYLLIIFSEYLMLYWDPPKDTLKDRVKERLSSLSLKPTLSPT